MATKNQRNHKSTIKRPGKVFDVRRPGKAPASATSRPIIVGHKPLAQKAQVAVSGIGAAPLMLNPTRKIIVRPREERAPEEKPHDPAETPTLVAARTIQPPAQAEALGASSMGTTTKLLEPPPTPADGKTMDTVEEPKPATPPEPQTPAPAPAAAVDAQVPTPPTAQPSAPKPLPDEALLDGRIDPLFDDHGLVVSHHTPAASAWKVIGLLLLILLLAAAILDILLDMGTITLDGIPHTDFLEG